MRKSLRNRIQQKLTRQLTGHPWLIIAESALLECRILLSGDAHLRGVDFQRLTLLLKDFDVAAPVIATPSEIVRKFFR